MSNQTFQLAVLISLINDSNVLGTTEESKRQLAEYVYGNTIAAESFAVIVAEVKEHICHLYPKVKEAAKLVAHCVLDQVRYNKMVDLYRMNHVIAPMCIEVA